MKFAAIGPIAVHLPEKVEDNASLGAQFPKWDMPLIYAKTGVRQRHIAAPDECASDLGVAAAERLFREHSIDRSSIDFLLFCTQTPDYVLPTTACLMQDRLGLPTSIGALDFNLGCSGFVYGLSLADGLIRSGIARRVLLVTAETYSKYIDPTDRSLRTILATGRQPRWSRRRTSRRWAPSYLAPTAAGPIRCWSRKAAPGQRPRPSNRGNASVGRAACTWMARNWSSSALTWCRRWSIGSWPGQVEPR